MQVRHKVFGEWGNAYRYFADTGKVLVDWEAGPYAKASGSNHEHNLVFRVPASTAPLTFEQRVALWSKSAEEQIYGTMQRTFEIEGYKVYDPRDH